MTIFCSQWEGAAVAEHFALVYVPLQGGCEEGPTLPLAQRQGARRLRRAPLQLAHSSAPVPSTGNVPVRIVPPRQKVRFAFALLCPAWLA